MTLDPILHFRAWRRVPCPLLGFTAGTSVLEAVPALW